MLSFSYKYHCWLPTILIYVYNSAYQTLESKATLDSLVSDLGVITKAKGRVLSVLEPSVLNTFAKRAEMPDNNRPVADPGIWKGG